MTIIKNKTAMLSGRFQKKQIPDRLLQTILERMDDAFFLIAADGSLLDFNQRACNLLGFTHEEMVARKWSDLLPRTCSPMGCAALRGDLSSQAPVHECCLRHRHGHLIPVEINAGIIEQEKDGWIFYLARDISERKKADTLLRNSEQRFRSFFQNAAAGMAILAPDARILEANAAFSSFIGYSTEELNGMPVARITCRDSLRETQNNYQSVSEGETTYFNYEKQYVRKDGTIVCGRVTVTWVCNETGVPEYGIGLVQDITEHREAEKNVERLSHYDPLTGLPNRQQFQDMLALELDRLHETGGAIGVLFLDMDRFKRVNDTIGHAAGDLLLRQVGTRLVELTDAQDIVARLGGDEFAIVLRKIDKAEDAERIAEKILRGFGDPFSCDDESLQISVSIGVAMVPSDGQDVESLLKNAEIAMYHAKESGRNGHQFYSSDIHARAVYRQLLESNLLHALDNEEFSLHYQPQMNLEKGNLIGMEALLRWQNPVLGSVPPDKFISLAEESGLILKIGEWVLRTACQQAKSWQRSGYPELRVAVNVSGRQFRQADFPDVVQGILDETGLSPTCLEIELTESCIMDDPDQVCAMLQRLKSMGVHLAVDDFGTGYSSLSYLKHFPFDRVKIDRSFVRDIDIDPDDAIITETIIAMAHMLGLEVLAEGAEKESHVDFLRQHGCEEVQGYFYSRPLPVKEFSAYLTAAFGSKEGRTLKLA